MNDFVLSDTGFAEVRGLIYQDIIGMNEVFLRLVRFLPVETAKKMGFSEEDHESLLALDDEAVSNVSSIDMFLFRVGRTRPHANFQVLPEHMMAWSGLASATVSFCRLLMKSHGRNANLILGANFSLGDKIRDDSYRALLKHCSHGPHVVYYRLAAGQLKELVEAVSMSDAEALRTKSMIKAGTERRDAKRSA